MNKPIGILGQALESDCSFTFPLCDGVCSGDVGERASFAVPQNAFFIHRYAGVVIYLIHFLD